MVSNQPFEKRLIKTLSRQCPRRDLNPRQGLERPRSLAGLDDRGVLAILIQSAKPYKLQNSMSEMKPRSKNSQGRKTARPKPSQSKAAREKARSEASWKGLEKIAKQMPGTMLEYIVARRNMPRAKQLAVDELTSAAKFVRNHQDADQIQCAIEAGKYPPVVNRYLLGTLSASRAKIASRVDVDALLEHLSARKKGNPHQPPKRRGSR